MAEILKGRVSKILNAPTDQWGHPTHAQVNPNTNSGAVTYAIVIPWWLRGRTGALRVGDEVCYSVFDDGTGLIVSRADGHWQGVMDYDVTTSGDRVNEKTETTHGDVFNKSNVTTDLVTTSKGQIIGQGGMAISGSSGGASATVTGTIRVVSGDVQADGISLKGHTHLEQGDGAPTGPAQ